MDNQNLFYLFLPFQMRQEIRFLDGVRGLEYSGYWEREELETRYMYRYISDKLASVQRQCVCFRLNEAGKKAFSFLPEQAWYELSKQGLDGTEGDMYRFRVSGVRTYCFNTGMGILVYELTAQSSEPMYLSNLQCALKNVGAWELKTQAERQESAEQTRTLLSLANRMLRIPMGEKVEGELGQFFVYANPGSERANVLTCLEVSPERYKERKKDLFYLRRCYNSSYEYYEDAERDREELFATVGDVTWGVTSEAAVCLVSLSEEKEGFFHGTFRNNFKNQYVYMYVLLLHQKYVLYHFLTQIGQGTYRDLETLEQYHVKLCAFETDFIFSRITDVPQYQQLYDMISRAFALRELYQDVKDPVTHLSELRQAQEEKAQQQRERGLNLALALLSLLAIFSGLADGFAFCDVFFLRWGSEVVVLAKEICFGVVALVGSVVVWNLIKMMFSGKK